MWDKSDNIKFSLLIKSRLNSASFLELKSLVNIFYLKPYLISNHLLAPMRNNGHDISKN
jgi:hypothetical protein